MYQLHKISTPKDTAFVEDLIAEAAVLFPEFLREGEVLTEAELARHAGYKRFLRIGISIWVSGGEPSVRHAMASIASRSGATRSEASKHLEYLWNGIPTGCLAPANQSNFATGGA